VFKLTQSEHHCKNTILTLSLKLNPVNVAWRNQPLAPKSVEMLGVINSSTVEKIIRPRTKDSNEDIGLISSTRRPA